MKFFTIQAISPDAPCQPQGYARATCGAAAKRFAYRPALQLGLHLAAVRLLSTAIAASKAPCDRPALRALYTKWWCGACRAVRATQRPEHGTT